MSGIEVVGIILGAFPLAISAMEHFEESKKVAGTFFKIRRAHRKDLGRIKDCQLKFRLNIKELLLPLLSDDIVTRLEYEHLLVHPGGPGWQEEHVDETLAERLGDCHERYMEILHEMEETMLALCKATRVDDEDFKSMLESRNTGASTATAKARSKLMLRAYTTLQAKKLAYAFTISQRENLLEEVEDYNAKLESVLLANDRVSSLLGSTSSRPKKPRIPKAMLHFWHHADCIFGLLGKAWKCHCKGVHDARLWLKRRVTAKVDLQVMLQFCHGARQCMQIQFASDAVIPSHHSNPSAMVRLPLRPVSQQSIVPSITVQHSSTTANISISSQSCTSVKQKGSKVSWILDPQQIRQAGASGLKDLEAEGICQTMRHAACQASKQHCYGVLSDHAGDRHYTVTSSIAPSNVSGNNLTLADLLEGRCSVALTRMQRYSIASTIASSLLQLESSPWAQAWSSSDVYFSQSPAAGTNGALEYDQPFIQTRLDHTIPPGGDSFKALGTLLLELCFGKALDEHALWQQPAFASSKANPLLRHFIACEWLKDVEGEAGDQYADAVRFCLHQAPVASKDEKWRLDFAQSVAWPLQQCFESMRPSR